MKVNAARWNRTAFQTHAVIKTNAFASINSLHAKDFAVRVSIDSSTTYFSHNRTYFLQIND